MAALSDTDLIAIMGPDFKRKMETSVEVSEISTPEEHAASRARRAGKLADLRFSFAALMFTGFALLAGAYYSNVGLGSVQGLMGAGAIALSIAGMVFIAMKRATLLREANDALARA